MKTKFLTMVTLVSSLGLAAPALAGDRVDLEYSQVQQALLKEPRALELIRVYTSHDVLIRRENGVEGDTDVSDRIDTRRSRRILSEKLSDGARGKLLEINSEAAYATFDPACAQKACAFRFAQVNHPEDGRRVYVLADVPPNARYSKTQVFRGRHDREKDAYNAGRNPIWLEVKVREFDDVIRENRRIPGWD